jgi:RNA polymerase sigma-70 factor (ECF subfamily)
MTEKEIIRGCRAGNALAQKTLYSQWGPLLLGVVRRYLPRAEDAEDVFVEGMFKILTKIGMFREEGSFEGWMKRIYAALPSHFLWHCSGPRASGRCAPSPPLVTDHRRLRMAQLRHDGP